jgi:hypothetical protein
MPTPAPQLPADPLQVLTAFAERCAGATSTLVIPASETHQVGRALLDLLDQYQECYREAWALHHRYHALLAQVVQQQPDEPQRPNLQ